MPPSRERHPPTLPAGTHLPPTHVLDGQHTHAGPTPGHVPQHRIPSPRRARGSARSAPPPARRRPPPMPRAKNSTAERVGVDTSTRRHLDTRQEGHPGRAGWPCREHDGMRTIEDRLAEISGVIAAPLGHHEQPVRMTPIPTATSACTPGRHHRSRRRLHEVRSRTAAAEHGRVANAPTTLGVLLGSTSASSTRPLQADAGAGRGGLRVGSRDPARARQHHDVPHHKHGETARCRSAAPWAITG